MTSKAASFSLGDRPRQGKWTKEEEAYVDLLIEEFRSGALPLREGTTLRSFLSKMINCNPKRVSKKYENTNYNGKHKYEPSTIPMSLDEMRRRRERLQEHERRFLLALQRSEDDLNLDDPEFGASLEERRSTHTSGRETERATAEQDRAMAALLAQHKQKTMASCKKSAPPQNVVPRDRLSAELQSRMDFTNQFSGTGGSSGSANVRNLSLTNTANTTLTLPSAFATQTELDLMANLKYGKAMGGFEDPLGWQVRLQEMAAATQRAQRIVLEKAKAAAPFPLPQYLRDPSRPDSALKRVTGDTTFPTLAGADFHRQSNRQLGSMVAREERLAASGIATNLEVLEARRRSHLISEVEMMESLKRGRERQEAMDALRPFKRLR